MHLLLPQDGAIVCHIRQTHTHSRPSGVGACGVRSGIAVGQEGMGGGTKFGEAQVQGSQELQVLQAPQGDSTAPGLLSLQLSSSQRSLSGRERQHSLDHRLPFADEGRVDKIVKLRG